MEKNEIKNIVNEVLDMAEPYDLIGYLEYDFKAMELFYRKKTNNMQFTLKKAPHDDNSKILKPIWKDNVVTIYLPTKEDHFTKRLYLAIGLGLMAYHYLPDNPFYSAELLFSSSEGKGDVEQLIMYFAQKLLQERTHLFQAKGDCIRDKYARVSHEIPLEIKKRFPLHDEGSLSECDKKRVEDFLKAIHDMLPGKASLDFEMTLVSAYVERKHKAPFKFRRKPSWGISSNNAITYPYAGGCNIYYSSDNTPREQRVLIAHEVGNIACHWNPDRDKKESEDERKEATYFSKILLQKRAELYLGGMESERYKEACVEIDQIIRKIYSKHDWLDWVLDDKKFQV